LEWPLPRVSARFRSVAPPCSPQRWCSPVAFTRYSGLGDNLPSYLGEDARKYAGDAKAIGELESPDPAEQLYEIKPDVIVSAKVRRSARSRNSPIGPGTRRVTRSLCRRRTHCPALLRRVIPWIVLTDTGLTGPPVNRTQRPRSR
jgi:hypothetical protein